MEGDWSTPDLQAFMDLLNEDDGIYNGYPGQKIAQLYERIRFWFKRNSKGAGAAQYQLSLRSRQRFLPAVAGRHDDLFQRAVR